MSLNLISLDSISNYCLDTRLHKPSGRNSIYMSFLKDIQLLVYFSCLKNPRSCNFYRLYSASSPLCHQIHFLPDTIMKYGHKNCFEIALCHLQMSSSVPHFDR